MHTHPRKLTLAALAVAAALTGGYTLGHANPASPTAIPPVVSAALPDMSGIVARNAAAVVNISVSGTRKVAASPGEIPGMDPEDPFYEFFRRFGVPQGRSQGQAPVRGQGSGFILSSDGTILTNAHVVEDADEVTVKLNDKREFKAKILGTDKASDVAVLKIDARDLPTVRPGNSSNTRVGEWVLAIGSPYGFESSASAGIVSAKSRALPDGSYVPFLQTDVAVNPGNSGGPLFNMAGEVIGINSQIYSRSGGYQGLSFAIPIEVAMNVERQIVAHGKVQRGRLGISIQEVNQTLADSFGLKKPQGALVNSVDKDGPAAKADLEPGDVILAINGKEVNASVELPAVVAAMAPGETAHLQVWRNGGSRTLDVKVGQFSETKQAQADTPEPSKGRLGVAVRPLSPEEQRQADTRNGVVIENISGPAARAGLQTGDIILSVNGEKVSTPEQLRTLISKAGKRTALLVERGNTRLFVPVELG